MPYASKVILRHCYYRSDPKLCPDILSIRRIPFSFHACTAIIYIYWDPKIKEAVNRHRYGRVYSYKYSQILGCRNNLIVMSFLYYRTD